MNIYVHTYILNVITNIKHILLSLFIDSHMGSQCHCDPATVIRSA